MKVFLSPSNQDANTWATGNTNEQIQAEAFADKLAALLKANGIDVIRADDVKPTRRINYATGCDLYIPLHTNAYNGSVRGCRLFVYKANTTSALAGKNDAAMKALRDEIDKLGMSEAVKLYYDYASWFELTNASNAGIPAVYSESIFHDNVADCEWYFANVDNFAEAYAKGICNYLGVSFTNNGTATSNTSAGTIYRVQVGAFSVKSYAEKMKAKLIKDGYDAFITQVGIIYKVQVGAFSVKANAIAMASELKAKGYSCFITEATISAPIIKVGSIVRVKAGAKTYVGGDLADFVYTRDHVVKEIKGDRVVITYNGIVVAAVKLSDLIYIRG